VKWVYFYHIQHEFFLPCAYVELLISPPGKQKVVVNCMTATSDTTNTLIAFILYHAVESICLVRTMISQQASHALNFI
jgi:hypothetical protein